MAAGSAAERSDVDLVGAALVAINGARLDSTRDLSQVAEALPPEEIVVELTILRAWDRRHASRRELPPPTPTTPAASRDLIEPLLPAELGCTQSFTIFETAGNREI